MKDFIKSYWKTLLFFALVGAVGGFGVGLYLLDGYPQDMVQQMLDQGLTETLLALITAVQSAGYGLILGGIGIYQPLVDWAGSGATVPLTGFGYNLAKGVREAVDSNGFLGIFTGGLRAAAGGITAAVVSALIVSLIFKAKDKA